MKLLTPLYEFDVQTDYEAKEFLINCNGTDCLEEYKAVISLIKNKPVTISTGKYELNGNTFLGMNMGKFTFGYHIFDDKITITVIFKN